MSIGINVALSSGGTLKSPPRLERAKGALGVAVYQYLLITFPIALYTAIESAHRRELSSWWMSPEWSMATTFLMSQALLAYFRFRVATLGTICHVRLGLLAVLAAVAIAIAAMSAAAAVLESSNPIADPRLRVALAAGSSVLFVLVGAGKRRRAARGTTELPAPAPAISRGHRLRHVLATAAHEYFLMTAPIALFLGVTSLKASDHGFFASPEWGIGSLFLTSQGIISHFRRLSASGRALSPPILGLQVLGALSVIVLASISTSAALASAQCALGSVAFRTTLFWLSSVAFFVVIASDTMAAARGGSRHE